MPLYQGTKIKIELSGGSHGEYVGGRLWGLPAGEHIDLTRLQGFMDRRAPGRYAFSTARRESDLPRFLSGLTQGVTDGGVLELRIQNEDVRRGDYDELKSTPRPGHADLGAWYKYGSLEPARGGGQFSGRMTAPLCALGAAAAQILERRGVEIFSHALSIGGERDVPFDRLELSPQLRERIEANPLPVISRPAGERMLGRIESAARAGDSVGGIVECAVTGFPAGLGGPLFDGIEGRLAALLFAIPAVKGVDFGAGYGAALMSGSENNDEIAVHDGKPYMLTNNAGGILGGISTASPIIFTVAFKPTPSISREQRSVELIEMRERTVRVNGRHDACIVPRAAAAVEATAALALLDILMEE